MLTCAGRSRISPLSRRAKSAWASCTTSMPTALWAVAEKFQRAEAEALLKLKFEVESVDDQASLGSEAARAHAMESLARDIFWIMAKDAIGQDAWNAQGVGVRSGWMLVTITSPTDPGRVLKGCSASCRLAGCLECSEKCKERASECSLLGPAFLPGHHSSMRSSPSTR